MGLSHGRLSKQRGKDYLMKYNAVKYVNDSTRFLIPIIFSPEAVASLSIYGLQGVYLDDYGYRSKFLNCLFFLFKPKSSHYSEFEKKIADFESFTDWYELKDGKRMYVFKIHPAYYEDIESFRSNRLEEMSERFYEISEPGLNLLGVNVDLSKEIYRFEAANQ